MVVRKVIIVSVHVRYFSFFSFFSLCLTGYIRLHQVTSVYVEGTGRGARQKRESKEEIQRKRKKICGFISSSSEDENFDVKEPGTVIPESSPQPGCSYWRDDREDPVTSLDTKEIELSVDTEEIGFFFPRRSSTPNEDQFVLHPGEDEEEIPTPDNEGQIQEGPFSRKIIVRYKEIEKGTKGRRRKTSKPGARSTDLLNSGKDRDDDKKVLCKMIKSKMMMKIIHRMIQDL